MHLNLGIVFDMQQRTPRKRARKEAEADHRENNNPSEARAVDRSVNVTTTPGPVDIGTEDSQTTTYTRDGELWYEDGTIILVAGGMGFKVHKRILVKQSLVFEDMFSFPQPPGVQACPVIFLQDSPEDLRHFLCFLMPAKKSR